MEDDSSLDSLSDKEDSESKEGEEERSDIDLDDIELDAKIEEARKALQVWVENCFYFCSTAYFLGQHKLH